MSYEFKLSDVYYFARYLNSEVREKGNELNFKYCPFCKGGNHNDKYTFSINLNNGMFKCLRSSCSEQGGFITLAKTFGFHLDFGSQRPLKKSYKKLPDKPIEIRNGAIEYLKSRGISEETAKRYKITTQANNDRVIVFPFFDWNNKLTMVKYRNADFIKGKSQGCKEWTEKDTKPILFGIQNVDYEHKSLVITEGQLDSLSLSEAGIKNALSVPNGKNAFEWLNTCWDFLKNFEEIIVFGDNENGKITLVDEINSRVKCKVRAVQTKDYQGKKDANDILRYCENGRELLRKAVQNALPVPIKHIIDMSEVAFEDIAEKEHILTGIPELDKVIGGFYMGQLVILSGKRGGGKSTLMSQFIIEALDQGVNVFAYSGELPNYQFMNWLMLQTAGNDYIYSKTNKNGFKYSTINDKTRERINSWIKGRGFMYDSGSFDTSDQNQQDELLTVIENAIVRNNVRFVCIDNLMSAMEIISSDVYNAQAVFVKKLKELAMKHNVAILLVAHKKKNSNGTSPEDHCDSISGSGDISNRADTVLSFVRTDNSDEKIEDEKTENEEELPFKTEPSGMLLVVKNRLFGRIMAGDNGISTYYDSRSKRIYTPSIKYRHYGWEGYDLDAEDSEPLPPDLPF